jgi:hypothetical protein
MMMMSHMQVKFYTLWFFFSIVLDVVVWEHDNLALYSLRP